jgi:hypothetical protein
MMVALALAGPASAGSDGVPDAQVRRAGGPQLGDDIINETAAGQTVGGHQARRYRAGAVRWFYAYVYNDGSGEEAFTMAATTSSTETANLAADSFVVQYFSPSGQDITSSVQNGTYTTPTVPIGGRYGIKVKVTVTAQADHGSEIELILTMASDPHPFLKDAVGIKMRKK